MLSNTWWRFWHQEKRRDEKTMTEIKQSNCMDSRHNCTWSTGITSRYLHHYIKEKMLFWLQQAAIRQTSSTCSHLLSPRQPCNTTKHQQGAVSYREAQCVSFKRKLGLSLNSENLHNMTDMTSGEKKIWTIYCHCCIDQVEEKWLLLTFHTTLFFNKLVGPSCFCFVFYCCI